jgi:hypothetical protein
MDRQCTNSADKNARWGSLRVGSVHVGVCACERMIRVKVYGHVCGLVRGGLSAMAVDASQISCII